MLTHVQPNLIRGNIDTRLAKLDAGEYDAIVLAEAGLDALGIKREYTRLFIARSWARYNCFANT